MNSPQYQLRSVPASPYFQIALYAGGQVLAVAILLLVWFSWGILAAFQEPLLWAWLCSLSLRDIKRFLVSTARRELLSSSFIICCAKLVFLPAVIAWQLIEEVRDKLQAKYHEIQASSKDNAAHVASAADTGSLEAAASIPCSNSRPPTDTDTNTHCQASAAAESTAASHSSATRSSQLLRQRKAAGKPHHKQQHQRPPLDPRATAAGGAAAAKQRTAGPAAKKRQGAATATAVHASRSKSGHQQQAPQHKGPLASPLQQRVARLHEFFRQLFSGYGFIFKELLRLILGGLLPGHSQTQQQQQQQHRQHTWPAVGTNSTLVATGLPPHMAMPPMSSSHTTDLASLTSSHQTSMAGSMSDSYTGSCRSECNMPWTPHPHWQQLLLQQQHHHHAAPVPQQQQQQQQSARGLSSSCSSPSLHTAAVSRQLLPPGPAAAPAAAAVAGLDAKGPGDFERNSRLLSAACTSFSGWAAAGTTQEQQQVQQQLSRADSTASCSTGQTAGVAQVTGHSWSSTPAGNGSAAAAAGTALQQQQAAGVAAAANASSLPYTLQAFSLPSQLPGQLISSAAPTPAGSMNGVLMQHFAEPGPQQGSGGYEAASLVGGYWEAAGGAVLTPPGSVSGMGAGPDRSNPSAVLFKGLLRSIVLYEGYRFVRGFLAAEQSLFMPLLLLGTTLAVAGGLPFLLLPASLLHPSAARDDGSMSSTRQRGDPHRAAPEELLQANGTAGSSQQAMHSPFSEVALGDGTAAAAAAAGGIAPGNAAVCGRRQALLDSWSVVQRAAASGWSWLVAVLVKADVQLRMACASSFLDTAVSGLIVVGLILGSVVLSAVLLVQIGDESRQAVVSLNSLVRQKGTEAGLTEGVWSLVQQYEGQLMGMTQYVLKETLPGLTLYVETRASDFLISHNLSKVLIDWEVVRAALKLPADCGEEARVRLGVQLANSSLAEASLGSQRQQLQQQLDEQQQLLARLATELQTVWINGSSMNVNTSSSITTSNSNATSNSNLLAQEVLRTQELITKLQEDLHNVTAGHEAASEQLKLAELRVHNCLPSGSSSEAVAAAAGLADAAKGRGLLSNLVGGLKSSKDAAGGTAAAGGGAGSTGKGSAVVVHGSGAMQSLSHARGMLAALATFDFASAGREATAMLGQLMPQDDEGDDVGQRQGSQSSAEEAAAAAAQQQQQGRQLQRANSCGPVEGEMDMGAGGSQQEPLPLRQLALHQRCPADHTCAAQDLILGTNQDAAGTDAADAACQISSSDGKGASSSSSGGSSSSSSSSSASTSLVRVARGAAYPLITLLRHVSSVVVAGLGSTTAVALGTGLGVLRLGLGVAKFLVQLGVFASVLYTLLALDIDPVEQLLKLLPISEASQDRASRAVTKALRGVFVSSIKLAAFHAGFTWLTLRAFGTHFVCTATVASAIVAVLPLVPVYLAALPAVLELVLARGAPVKALVLLALHLGAYTFGDDLIYREIEPTLPYLVGLGVFGGMWHFANPLQGVLLGPMVLALLSVGYNLHRELY